MADPLDLNSNHQWRMGANGQWELGPAAQTENDLLPARPPAIRVSSVGPEEPSPLSPASPHAPPARTSPLEDNPYRPSMESPVAPVPTTTNQAMPQRGFIDQFNEYMGGMPQQAPLDYSRSYLQAYNQRMASVLPFMNQQQAHNLQLMQMTGIPGNGATSLPGGTMQLGTTPIPGSMQNAAQDSATRAQENARFGPEARYDAFYNQAYNSFPPGTPHGARVRQLQTQGMTPPEFLTGGGRPSGTSGTSTPGIQSQEAALAPGARPSNRPIPTQSPGGSAIDTAFETGMSMYPMDPATGRRNTTMGGDPNHAITQILENIPNEVLRASFPEIQQRLTAEIPGGAPILDAWINQVQGPLNISDNARRRSIQIRRLLAAANMRMQPVTPFSQGLNPFERVANVLGAGGITTPLNYATDWLGLHGR